MLSQPVLPAIFLDTLLYYPPQGLHTRWSNPELFEHFDGAIFLRLRTDRMYQIESSPSSRVHISLYRIH